MLLTAQRTAAHGLQLAAQGFGDHFSRRLVRDQRSEEPQCRVRPVSVPVEVVDSLISADAAGLASDARGRLVAVS